MAVGLGVDDGSIVDVERGIAEAVGVGAKVCANKVTAADCAVPFISVRLIVGDVLLVDEVPQAASSIMITRDIIDTRFELFICNSISTSQNNLTVCLRLF